ncbi:hypothetical protein EDD86DRAFT_250538 [Gorgonomyces haynaldii]|nr:hypothetical protein EDD86DRAFT_250538 [Gorgonomyces haynaldii]
MQSEERYPAITYVCMMDKKDQFEFLTLYPHLLPRLQKELEQLNDKSLVQLLDPCILLAMERPLLEPRQEPMVIGLESDESETEDQKELESMKILLQHKHREIQYVDAQLQLLIEKRQTLLAEWNGLKHKIQHLESTPY